MIAFGRIMTAVMFGGVCFLLIVPLALQRHQIWLAAGASVLYAAYLVTNVVLWRRMKSRP
jgi:hypothetical protein